MKTPYLVFFFFTFACFNFRNSLLEMNYSSSFFSVRSEKNQFYHRFGDSCGDVLLKPQL